MATKKKLQEEEQNPDQPKIVRQVEQHIVKQGDPNFARIDEVSFAAKNLYNLVNDQIRQAYILDHHYLTMKELWPIIKPTDAYQALPRKVSNQVIWQVYRAWGSYYEAVKVWRVTPDLFKARPRIPKYKKKLKGRAVVTYEQGAIGMPKRKDGLVIPSQLGVVIPSEHAEQVEQVRIVPRKGFYVIEIVYSVEVQENEDLNKDWIAGIDIGVNVLAALTSNKPGFKPVVVNGRPLKSINQFYNKRKAELQADLAIIDRYSSNKTHKLTGKRGRKIKHYLHGASRQMIDLLLEEKIGVLVIGRNKNWKQKANIGKKNNQNFVQIPYSHFIQMLTYKAQLAGIRVILQEESHTSKCSFLDLEPIKHHKKYLGSRMKRGLFKASDGRTIHADLNGSYNIIRKAIPDAFRNGIEGIAVCPTRFILVN